MGGGGGWRGCRMSVDERSILTILVLNLPRRVIVYNNCDQWWGLGQAHLSRQNVLDLTGFDPTTQRT